MLFIWSCIDDLYGCLSVQVLRSASISNKPLLISNLLLLAPAALANIGSGIYHNYVHTSQYSELTTDIENMHRGLTALCLEKSLNLGHCSTFCFSAGSASRSCVYVICDRMSSGSPFLTKQIPQLHFFFLPHGISDRLSWVCQLSYNAYFLQSWMCALVYLCVGVYSPQASRSNVIVFNALFTYPWAKHICAVIDLACFGR